MHASSAFAQQVALTLVGTLLLTLGMVFDGPSASNLVATKSLAPAESLAPTYPWTVWTEDHCVRPGIPDRATYTSLEEMVKDTIPGEWWSRTNPAYVVPLNHGALKSAAIITGFRWLLVIRCSGGTSSLPRGCTASTAAAIWTRWWIARLVSWSVAAAHEVQDTRHGVGVEAVLDG